VTSGPPASPADSPRRPRPSAAKRIGLATTTGLGAKALGLGAQVVAVAVAVRSLGADGFATYVVIASLVSWMSLAGLGVAPGLTLGVARASATDDRAEEARLFSAALLSMTAVASILIVGAAVLGVSGIVDELTSGWLGAGGGDASAAVIVMVLLLAVQLVVVVPEAAQLGLQEQHISNLWAGFGSAAAILAMLVAGGGVTSVTAFVLISQGPQITARATNGILFTVGHRHRLRAAPKMRFWRHARTILGSGAAFAGLSLASYLMLQGGVLVMAATTDAASVALAGVMARGYMLVASGLSLLTTPTWPAIAGARSRGDVAWVRRTYRVLLGSGLAYATVWAVIVLLGFEDLIGAWTGSEPTSNPALRAFLAAFLVVNAWGHVNAMTLVGLGALGFTALVLIAEAVVVLVIIFAVAPIASVTGYAAALAAGAALVSGWILPLRVFRELRTDPRHRR